MPPTRPSTPACVGYVNGIYDLQFAPTPPRGVCTPADLTPELLAEVVTAYVDTHEDGPAPAAIGQAIVRFFPCPNSIDEGRHRRLPRHQPRARHGDRAAPLAAPNRAWSGTRRPTCPAST